MGQAVFDEIRGIILSTILIEHPKLSVAIPTLAFMRRILQFDQKMAS